MEAKELSEKLGTVINKMRRIKQLSRPDLAEKSGVSAITIQRVEAGTAVGLGLDNLLSLAKGLDVSVSDLLSEAEKGEGSIKKIHTKWEYLSERIDNFTLNQKDWITKILQDILERPNL